MTPQEKEKLTVECQEGGRLVPVFRSVFTCYHEKEDSKEEDKCKKEQKI